MIHNYYKLFFFFFHFFFEGGGGQTFFFIFFSFWSILVLGVYFSWVLQQKLPKHVAKEKVERDLVEYHEKET